ncbi:DUF1980 domain-containing protein [Clostridium gasigenes]|uniref:TIGR03943 family putative permease subunit n=1 Tax=Clostridium gasigenes TaxID=94869 RepID=UPI0014382DC5|nr:DUF1980 domain-containing protein [Clostridium gasigenes]MBU3130958.1 DUF1980 domain-containing protein [Clostridium gasigenes]NKF07244.1 DUF1980 domain-containing protein [Clostridium gasigenes]QSW18223.1 DUF1980 domain-containing protein [Clostridium gasigenes]
MRRFNLDELIWFILLLLLTSLWGYLILSGSIYGLVNPRMVKYSYFAFVIFIILTIFQLSKILTFPSRIDMSNKFIPLIFTLFMAVAYISINSSYAISSSLLLTEDQVKFNYTGNYISIDNNNNKYHLIEDLNIDSEYIDKTISIVGYVDRNGHLPENIFLISRDTISCCLQDLSTISLFCKETHLNNSTNTTNTANIKNGSWVKALGKIKYENGNAYLEIIELTVIKEPEKKYYTPGV